MSIVTLNMHEAKTHLSSHIAALKPGDRIILCRRNKAVAEIRPLTDEAHDPRPIGLGKGKARIPDSFFEPLPDDIVQAFEEPR